MKKLLLIFVLLLLVCSNYAFSTTIAWTGGTSSNWNTASNWSGGAVPNTGDIVNIGTGTNFTNQPNISTAPANAPSIINIGNSKAVTLTINSGFTLTVNAINMSATSINSAININGTLAVTGNITLGATSSNTYNEIVLGTNGILVLGGAMTGGTFDNGTGNSIIQLNGTVAQSFPSSTPSTTFLNNIGLLHDSNLAGVTLATNFSALSNSIDQLIVDNNCTFNANAQLSAGTNFYVTAGVNSVYISKSTFSQYANDVYDATATVQFTAPNQVINLCATATATNTCPNVIFSGTSITINAQSTNSIFKVRGNLSVSTSTSVAYNNVTAINIGGNFLGINSLLSATLPITIGGSWTNTATGTIAGTVTYNGATGNTQVVATNVTYGNNLTFQNASPKQIASGTLNFQGATFDNSSGSYLDCVTNTTTVNMNGAVVQTISGGTATNANIATDVVSGTTFYNLTIANTAAVTPTVTLAGNVNIAPSGVLTITASNNKLDATASNSLTLMSTGTGTATVAAISAGSTITGTVNVQRYITGGAGYRGYRLLSSPVYTATVAPNNVYSINYLQTGAYLTGSAGGGFDKTGNPTLYLFREDIKPSNDTFISGNFWGISAINNATAYNYYMNGGVTNYNIPVGNGFMFFFRGNRASAIVGAETSTTYVPVTVTMSAPGTLNQGQIIVHDWYTPASANLGWTNITANTAVRGYNFVGNPYASSIDWEQYNTTTTTTGIYANNVGNIIYELNPTTNNYDSYQKGGTFTNHGSRTIASGQGFFVIAANNTNPELIFNESAKSATQNTGLHLFMAAKADVAKLSNANIDQHLRLQLAMDSINSDDIYIGFDAAASSKYVFNEDAPYKTGNGKVSLASISGDSVLLAINRMPLPKQSRIISLHITARTYGIYKLNMTEMEAIPELYEVWLMDRYHKDSLDMRHNKTYAFDITADTNSYGSTRFQLVIRQNTALGVHLLNFTAAKATNGAQIVWKTENEQNYTNFTVERSTDNGATFNVLGGFASSALGNYSLLDKAPLLAVNQYRLKTQDMNGTVSYSNIVTLIYGNSSNTVAANVSVYPNPASNVINLAINKNSSNGTSSNLPVLQTLSLNPGLTSTQTTTDSQSYEIKIISITGSVMIIATSSQNNWRHNVSRLAPGTYVIQVVNNSNKSIVGKTTFVKL